MNLTSSVGGPSLGDVLNDALIVQINALSSPGGGALGAVTAAPQIAPVQLVDDNALSLTIGDGDARPLLVSDENGGKDGDQEGRRSGKVVILAQYN